MFNRDPNIVSLKVRYTPVESATCFAFNKLVQKIKKDIMDRNPTLKNFDKINEIIYKSLQTFSLNGQTFEYESHKNHLGGCRWFVKCPKCGKPKIHLYLPVKDPEKEQKYYCRECHALRNMSLILGNTANYNKIIKPLKRLQKLRKILMKNLPTERSMPYLEEYERIERELLVSPEYRLWKFKMEHGSDKHTV